MGGTARITLEMQLDQAVNGLTIALTTLQEAAPHPRDYVQSSEAWERALAEYRDRVKRVRSVLTELRQMREALADGRAETHHEAWKETR
jgi:DNA-binding PadR family transcriptional regulator